jgi:hypothetical protein
VGLLGLLACAPGSPSSAVSPAAGAEGEQVLDARRAGHGEASGALGPGDFSAERAWANLESIVEVGPRPAASPAAAAARNFVENRLAASGLELEELEFELPAAAASGNGDDAPRHATSLLARLDGPTPDLLLVAAPYTSPAREGASDAGANQGGSGAAVALELARALAEGERRYSYLFAFIAGDGDGVDPVAGSRELARVLAQRGLLERSRAALFLDRVGDAELRIARDLHSSGPYRDIVWERARARGHAAVFAEDGFDATAGGHRVLYEAGLSQIVALIGSSHAADLPPGEHARRESDELAHCAPESLGIVGTVALDALRTIESRLDRLDRYSSSPADMTRSSDRDREAASLTTPRAQSLPASDDAEGSR